MAEHEDRPEGEPTPEGEPASEDAWWESTAALLFTAEDKAALAAETDTGALPVLGAEPVLEERSTEWFNVEESFDDDADARLPRRHHHVTAVVVSHNGAVWLPAVLTTLAAQTRPPDAAVGVDTGSTDGSAALLRSSLGADRVVEAPADFGFGRAVQEGLDHVGAVHTAPSDEPVESLVQWVWLLHDDSAPDPSCLQALLDTADDVPTAGVLGPKILGWHDRRLLLEAGFSITGSGRRFTGLERREHDQGQHDGVRDVLAVSSAGMLVRREIWELLAGFDRELPLFRDDLDFCWRAHRAGARVVVATDAVLHHREAAAHGRRDGMGRMRPHREDREAAVHVLLAHATAFAAPFVALRLFFGSVLRSIGYLLGKDLRAARDEVAAVLDIALHPSRLTGSRTLVRVTATEPASVVRHLRPSWTMQLRHGVEIVAGVLTTSNAAPSATVSAVESGPVDDTADYLDAAGSGWIRRALLRPSVFLVAALTLFSVIATRDLWLGGGALQGGALLPVPTGAGDLWAQYTQAWHDVGPGSSVPAAPYLVLIWAVAVVLLGKAWLAVNVLLLLAIPLAGWAAYFTLRGVVRSRWLRVWAAVAYALLPAITGAMSSGRLGTAMAAILLPFVARSFVRISRAQGTFRRAAGTALLLAALISCVPAAWPIAAILAIVTSIVGLRRNRAEAVAMLRRIWFAVLAPLVLLLPWTVEFIRHPSLLLFEPGVFSETINDPTINGLDVLLLHPGGPGMTPIWITAGIVLAGFLAIMRRDRYSIVLLIWAPALLALILGVVQTVVVVAPPSMVEPIRPWPGPATLMLGFAFIAAASIAADGLQARLSRTSFNLLQPIAAIVAILAILSPIASAIVWLPQAVGLLRNAPRSAVPAFVAADAVSPQAPRTLVLDQRPDGRVRYSLINGSGPVLGDAEVAPPADVWAPIDPLVAALASGRGGDEVEGLAAYGIRYVLLAAGSSDAVIPRIDSEPGLRRLSSAGGEVLWRVAGLTSRARIVAGDEGAALELADGENPASDPYLATTLPTGAGGRELIVGAVRDDGWRAVRTSDGGVLAPVEASAPNAWSTAFAAPDGADDVRVWFDQDGRTRWLWWQLLVLVVLVVLALPSRRVEDVDPDDPDDLDDPDDANAVSATGTGVAR